MADNQKTAFRPKKPSNPTFRKLAEVEVLPGFRPDNTFNQDDFDSTFADYDGENLEFKCCLIKESGKRCGRPHDWGYVVRLKDGSLTLVGNDCIFRELEQDGHVILQIRSFLRQREHEERIKAVKEALETIPSRVAEMELYLEQISEVRKYLEQFRETFGNKLYNELVDRSRTGNSQISATGTKVRKYIDDDGEERTEKRKIPETISSIQALDLFVPNRVTNLRLKIESTLSFYRNFSFDHVTEDTTDGELNEMRARFEDFLGYGREVDQLAQSLRAFSGNNFSMFQAMFDENKTRERVLMAALQLAGRKTDKDTVRTTLHDFDQNLREKMGVDYVHYGRHHGIGYR